MKILFVNGSFPYPPVNGGQQRTELLYRSMEELGEVDYLLVGSLRGVESTTVDLLRNRFRLLDVFEVHPRGHYGAWRFVRPLAKKLIDRLAHNLGPRSFNFAPTPENERRIDGILRQGKYDVVVGRYLRPLAKSGALKHRCCVLDIDDFEPDSYASRLKSADTRNWERPFVAWHLRQLTAIYPPLLSRCSELFVSNPGNLRHPSMERATLLPNIPYCPNGAQLIRPDTFLDRDSRVILFVASMNHGPNVRSASWFIEMVWPHVRKNVPDALFRIVGSGVTNELKKRWEAASGVVVVGQVDDLRREYARAMFSIAPIVSGAGTNIKVLETFAYGRSCIVTVYGHRGYEADLREKEALFVGRDALEMARHCIFGLQYPAQMERMALAGWEVVANQYSFGRFSAVAQRVILQAHETSRLSLLDKSRNE